MESLISPLGLIVAAGAVVVWRARLTELIMRLNDRITESYPKWIPRDWVAPPLQWARATVWAIAGGLVTLAVLALIA